MNIKRYKAPDMRSAFKQIRAEHGEEVVMLSSRRIAEGIEVVVAIDQALGAVLNAPVTVPQSVNAPSKPARDAVQGVNGSTAPAVAVTNPPASFPQADASAEVARVDQEIRALRRLLETQLAALAWNDLSRRSPAVAEVMQELMDRGFDRELVQELLTIQPNELGLTELRQRVQSELASQLSSIEDRWIETGGQIAVVGAAGSGKSTALAAIAARWVMRHGAHSAALVSAVESRFGVRENLQRIGRLVGLPVFIADSWQEVPALLRHLADRRLVLLDTPTVSIRQAEFTEHLKGLADLAPTVQFALTLSAATQVDATREVLQRYQSLPGMAAVITHLDECSSLGGVLTALIEHRLPLAYTLGGARLLDDLKPARGDDLISMAAELTQAARDRRAQERTTSIGLIPDHSEPMTHVA
jgi:flagellar biosynthesis protein FlhF